MNYLNETEFSIVFITNLETDKLRQQKSTKMLLNLFTIWHHYHILPSFTLWCKYTVTIKLI